MKITNLERSKVTANSLAEFIEEIKDDKDFLLVLSVKENFCSSLNITMEELNERLKVAKSVYLYDVLGYIDGNPITRFNLYHSFKKLILKFYKRIEYNNNEKLTFEERKDIFSFIERQLQCQ